MLIAFFQHHLCADPYCMVVVHDVIIMFRNMIRVSIVDVFLSINSTVLGHDRMLLYSDVLCACVEPGQEMLPLH